MAPTIFIKFCVIIIIHSKPNNVIVSAFPEKIPETGKIFLKIFFPFPNVGPKLTVQSRSNSTYRVLLQISIAHIFVFHLPL